MEALWLLDHDLRWGLKDLAHRFLLVTTSLPSKEPILPYSPYVHHYCHDGQGQQTLWLPDLVSVGTSPQLTTGDNMVNVAASLCHGLYHPLSR